MNTQKINDQRQYIVDEHTNIIDERTENYGRMEKEVEDFGGSFVEGLFATIFSVHELHELTEYI